MRKPAFCICENKAADRIDDQCLGFRYTASIILLLKSEIPSLWLSSVFLQPGLCPTWSDTQKTGFVVIRLILSGQQTQFPRL